MALPLNFLVSPLPPRASVVARLSPRRPLPALPTCPAHPHLRSTRMCASQDDEDGVEQFDNPRLPPGLDRAPRAGQSSAKAELGFVASTKLGLAFTCTVCETRSVKQISRVAYQSGVVLVKCKGCDKNHVIADHLGWYDHITGGLRTVEEIASSTGANFTRATPETFKLEKLLFDIETSDHDPSPPAPN